MTRTPYTNPDLHCHSTVSDGTLEPEVVAARARANGVDLWALTDHDEVGGLQRAAAAARAQGLAFLTGAEISVTFANTTVHIVGLGFDASDERLVQGLRQTRGGRGERAQEMAAQLAQVGIPGAYEGALRYVGNPELISRTHFARFLVEQRVCRDTGEVFRRFLTEGKPGFVPHRWASLRDAVRWICDAGGVAIIAHPARYSLSANEEFALFSEFRQHGGQGARRRDAAGRQYRHLDRVEHLGQQRQGADQWRPVSAALEAARHDDVDARIGGSPGRIQVRHLDRRGAAGVVHPGHPGVVVAEADAEQGRPRRQRRLEQIRPVGHHPVHQPDAERPGVAQLIQLGAQT